jgi:hypothetical protein
LKDLSADGRIILNWILILKKYGIRIGTGFVWLRIESSGRLL